MTGNSGGQGETPSSPAAAQMREHVFVLKKRELLLAVAAACGAVVALTVACASMGTLVCDGRVPHDGAYATCRVDGRFPLGDMKSQRLRSAWVETHKSEDATTHWAFRLSHRHPMKKGSAHRGRLPGWRFRPASGLRSLDGAMTFQDSMNVNSSLRFFYDIVKRISSFRPVPDFTAIPAAKPKSALPNACRSRR